MGGLGVRVFEASEAPTLDRDLNELLAGLTCSWDVVSIQYRVIVRPGTALSPPYAVHSALVSWPLPMEHGMSGEGER